MKEFYLDDKLKMVLNEKTGDYDYYESGKVLSKTADKLFKYYTLNFNNLDALLNNYFHLSNPGTFNDPFDCNINLISNIDYDTWGKRKDIRKNNLSNIGITSFSENIDSNLMWAHYTGNYSGFALEFKGDKITTFGVKEKFDLYTLTRVHYPIELKKIEQEIPFSMHYVLTTKMNHWVYEKEWRIICQLKNEADRVLFYDPNCVKAVYVGHRLIDNDTSAYRLLLEIFAIRFPKIPVYVVYPDPKDLKLIFEKVKN